MVLILIYAFFAAKDILLLPFSILANNLINLDIGNILVFTISYFLIIIYFPWFVINVIYKFLKKTPNKWLIFTVLIMMFSLLSGIVIIDIYLGTNRELKLFLRDENRGQKVVGEINCTSSNKFILVDDIVSCNISPNLINVTAKVFFTLKNGQIVDENFGNLSFRAKLDVKRLFFSINGIDSNGENINLTIGNDFTFLTETQRKEKAGVFLTYVLGLFALVLFSIPSAMDNFKKLSETK